MERGYSGFLFAAFATLREIKKDQDAPLRLVFRSAADAGREGSVSNYVTDSKHMFCLVKKLPVHRGQSAATMARRSRPCRRAGQNKRKGNGMFF